LHCRKPPGELPGRAIWVGWRPAFNIDFVKRLGHLLIP
jgi:hypothetical protein